MAHQLAWLALSGVLYLLGTLPVGAVFLPTVGGDAAAGVGCEAVLRAYYVSQMGKYVPGKAMVIVLAGGPAWPGRG